MSDNQEPAVTDEDQHVWKDVSNVRWITRQCINCGVAQSWLFIEYGTKLVDWVWMAFPPDLPEDSSCKLIQLWSILRE